MQDSPVGSAAPFPCGISHTAIFPSRKNADSLHIETLLPPIVRWVAPMLIPSSPTLKLVVALVSVLASEVPLPLVIYPLCVIIRGCYVLCLYFNYFLMI
jgi:hypothetical protein